MSRRGGLFGRISRALGQGSGPDDNVVPFDDWDFTARQVAQALTLVGRGSSYREAGATLRLDAGRFTRDAQGVRYPSRAGALVARYLDLFGPLIVEAVEHTTWPPIVLLDAVPLRTKVWDIGGGAKTVEASGAFLGAVGYTAPGGRPHFWKVRFEGGLDGASWFDFLSTARGEPEWVVTDGDEAVKAAVREKWGNRPVIYSCEGHLWRNYEKAALGDRLSPFALGELWGDAFEDEASWRSFLVRVFDHPQASVGKIADWIGRSHELILAQMRLRRDGYPKGTGALESSLGRLDDWIGLTRRRHDLEQVFGSMLLNASGYRQREHRHLGHS